MKDWITQRFEDAGLSFHQGKPKNDSPLNPLLKLMTGFGFRILETEGGGSHIVIYHPGLENWAFARLGRIVLPIKHSGSQNKPMVKPYYVAHCLKAAQYLQQKGILLYEPEDN